MNEVGTCVKELAVARLLISQVGGKKRKEISNHFRAEKHHAFFFPLVIFYPCFSHDRKERKKRKAAGLLQSGDLQLKSAVAVVHGVNLSRIRSWCSGCVNTAEGTFKSTDASRPLGCVKVKNPRDVLVVAPAAAVMSSTAASSPAATWQRLAIFRCSRRPSGDTRAVL